MLSGDSFIGRVEAVNDKKEKQLVIKNFWYEGDITNNDMFIDKIYECIERFAHFNNCESINIEASI